MRLLRLLGVHMLDLQARYDCWLGIANNREVVPQLQGSSKNSPRFLGSLGRVLTELDRCQKMVEGGENRKHSSFGVRMCSTGALLACDHNTEQPLTISHVGPKACLKLSVQLP